MAWLTAPHLKEPMQPSEFFPSLAPRSTKHEPDGNSVSAFFAALAGASPPGNPSNG